MEFLQDVPHVWNIGQPAKILKKASMGIDVVEDAVKPSLQGSIAKITKEELERHIVNVFPEL